MQPLISIIIPTYNRANIIGETLDSIIAQTYTNWECVVVDDGSNDTTPELMQKYMDSDSRFQYHQRPKNKPKGPNSCRNFGFEKSKGYIINFFDSDDVYLPNTFEKIIQKSNDDFDAIICKVSLKDFKNNKILKENNIESTLIIEDFFIENINFYICGPFWNNNFLKKQKFLFDEEIGNGDDWDFNLRMLYKEPNLCIINESLIEIRVHENSFSKEKGKLNKKEIKSEFKVLDKHLDLVKNCSSVNMEVTEMFVFKRYNRTLKWALFQKNDIKYFLLKEVLKKELKFNYYLKAFKTIIGFVLFSLFGKGYIFLKD